MHPFCPLLYAIRRPVAMGAPDNELIAEVSLVTEGFSGTLVYVYVCVCVYVCVYVYMCMCVCVFVCMCVCVYGVCCINPPKLCHMPHIHLPLYVLNPLPLYPYTHILLLCIKPLLSYCSCVLNPYYHTETVY
jgi:hypothetical protein